MRVCKTLVLFAACAVVLQVATQHPVRGQGAPAQPTFRVSVDRVEISAVVTDAKGRHVADLGIRDFTVLDGGKPQQLTHCEYVRPAGPRPAPPVAYGVAPPSSPGEVTHQLTRERVERTIVFLVDDDSFAAQTIPAARAAVKSVVEQLQRGDLAALIRTSSGNGSLEQFTSDKRILLESCERIRWRPESRGNPGMLPQTSGFVIGENMGRYLVMDSVNRTLAVLRYVISALRDLPGRKAVFFISQSLPYGTRYADPGPTSAATDIGEIVDMALRSGVVVYSVDPTPLSSLTPGADYGLGQQSLAQAAEQAELRFKDTMGMMNQDPARDTAISRLPLLTTNRALGLLEYFRSGLRALAEGTGGEVAADTDATAALARFADDLAGYYLLTFKPESPERYFGSRAGHPPPFRSIKIRVARAGVHVRSYAGYIAAEDPKPDTAPPDAISKALFSPFSASAIHVGLAPLFTQPKPGSPELNVLLHIHAGDLLFTADQDGRHSASFDLVARVAGERSGSAQVVTKRAVLRLEEDSFRQAMLAGVTYRVSLPAQRAGVYEVRVVVRDTADGKLGSAREYVAVPDLKNGRLAVSGVLVFNANPRREDAEAPGLAEARLFRRQDSLSYACQLFNAKSVRAEVYALRDGKQVMTAWAAVAPNGDGTRTARGAISLGALAPGDYVLQIIAREEGAKGIAASQWTDFEVVP